MGLYDIVLIDCPCGDHVEFQSKGGHCLLASYRIETAPATVLADISGEIEKCSCGRVYRIEVVTYARATVLNQNDFKESDE